MKKLAYTRADGGVSVIIPAPREAVEADLMRHHPTPPPTITEHVIEHEDGTVERVQNIVEATPWTLSQEEYESFVIQRHIDEGHITVDIKLHMVEDADLPDREFRDAWNITDGKIGHDLEKARTIQLNRIRLARAPKLAELDVKYMLAQEKQDTNAIADIVKQKESLRDVTEPLKTATLNSIDDVKAAFPQELKQ